MSYFFKLSSMDEFTMERNFTLSFLIKMIGGIPENMKFIKETVEIAIKESLIEKGIKDIQSEWNLLKF